MTKHTERTLLALFGYGTLLVAFTFAAVVLFWLLYPYQTIDQWPKPFEITYPQKVKGTALVEVTQGGSIAYKFNYIKHSSVIPTITRQFVDGLIFNEGITPPTLLEKGSGVAYIELRIPQTLPPGTYRLVINAKYQVNPIKHIDVENSTERFIVVASGDGDPEQPNKVKR